MSFVAGRILIIESRSTDCPWRVMTFLSFTKHFRFTSKSFSLIRRLFTTHFVAHPSTIISLSLSLSLTLKKCYNSKNKERRKCCFINKPPNERWSFNENIFSKQNAKKMFPSQRVFIISNIFLIAVNRSYNFYTSPPPSPSSAVVPFL